MTDSEKIVEEVSSNIVIPLDEVIAAAKASNTAKDLEDSLAIVKPGVGNCDSRRTLRRLIEFKLKDQLIQSQINAKSRRRFQRVLQILKPDPTLGALTAQKEKEAKKLEKQKNKVEKEKIVKEVVAPCVVFVGQLTYETTAEELEEYLRTNGVGGDITVRLRKDSETQISKGMGFVELEGPRELRKALSLHRTYLNGRRINIEQSCGGRNKSSRQQKIESLRIEAENSKNATIESTINDYTSKGILTEETCSDKVKSIMKHLTTIELKSVLDKYAEGESGARTENELCRLLYVVRRKQLRASYISAKRAAAEAAAEENADDMNLNEGVQVEVSEAPKRKKHRPTSPEK